MGDSKIHLQAIGQVASHNKWDLLLPQLLDGDLKRVGLTLDVYKHRRIHTVYRVSMFPDHTMAASISTTDSSTIKHT